MDSYFERDGSYLLPTARAAGAWNADRMHGRLIVGLIADDVQRIAHADGMRCARFTVDLLEPAPMQPVCVRTISVHRTSRSHVLDVVATTDSGGLTRASVVLLAGAETPPGEVWSAAPWNAPPPDRVEPVSDDQRSTLPWDARPVHGPDMVTRDRKAVWLRDPFSLVAGEVAPALVRLAMVADAVNPLANSGTRGLRYINTDLTLYLRRDPVGEWFGFEVTQHLATDGTAVGHCAVHDTDGPVGVATSVGLAMRRPVRRAEPSAASSK